MIPFALHDQPYIELHRLLKAVGLADSGGMAKVMIADGQVQVDGLIETRKRRKIRSGQRVQYAGQTIVVA